MHYRTDRRTDRRRFRGIWAARSALFAWCLFALPAAPARAERPGEPWVFRGNLEDRPGLVFLGLDARMALAYDTAGCSLWLAWNGKAEPETGPTAPAAPGAEPWGPGYRAAGPRFHKRINPSPWSMAGPQGNIPVTVRLVSAAPDGEQARLEYVLTPEKAVGKAGTGAEPGRPAKAGKAGKAGKAAAARMVKVVERPLYDGQSGPTTLIRNIEVTGLPPGLTLRLELSGRGMVETWSGGGAGWVEKDGDRVYLLQDKDGATPLQVTWFPDGSAGN